LSQKNESKISFFANNARAKKASWKRGQLQNRARNLNSGCNLMTMNAKQLKPLECGSVPNVMAALPNIGGALCSCGGDIAV